MNELAKLYREQDMIDAKIEILIESVQHRHDTALEKAENFILTEGGTSKELRELYEEAAADMEKKTKSVLGKILDAIVTFFKKIGESIANFFTSRGDKNLEDAEEEMKNNPFFKKSKVMVPNTKNITKICDEHEKSVKKLVGKVKSGQAVSVEEVDNIESSFLEKHAKALGVGAIVTVGAAVTLLLTKKKWFPKLVKQESSDIAGVELALIDNKFADDTDKNGISIRSKILEIAGRIKRVRVQAEADGIHEIDRNVRNAKKAVKAEGAGGIKSAAKGMVNAVTGVFKKKNNGEETIVEESVNMLDLNNPEIFDSAITESFDDFLNDEFWYNDDSYLGESYNEDEYGLEEGYTDQYSSVDNELDKFLESFEAESLSKEGGADGIGAKYTYTDTNFFDPEDLDDDDFYTQRKPERTSEIIAGFDTGYEVDGYPSKKASSSEVIKSMYRLLRDDAKNPFN